MAHGPMEGRRMLSKRKPARPEPREALTMLLYSASSHLRTLPHFSFFAPGPSGVALSALTRTERERLCNLPYLEANVDEVLPLHPSGTWLRYFFLVFLSLLASRFHLFA